MKKEGEAPGDRRRMALIFAQGLGVARMNCHHPMLLKLQE
jgi:hypothetical protein